jgi:predicted ATP-grasp superfamily ATP-dependent carboligase
VPVLRPGQILQRRVPGQAMSATFVADGRRARLLGVNRQSMQAHPVRSDVPYVFCGVVGPVPVSPAVLNGLEAALGLLVPAFGLRGLGSLDFLLHAGTWQLLEVNPRPPASVALYPNWRPMAAHVQACVEGRLPQPPSEPPPEQAVRGYEIVFARRSFRLDDAQAAALGAAPHTHDLPAGGQNFDAGDPLCSITLAGPSAPDVLARLGVRRDALLNFLEMPS